MPTVESPLFTPVYRNVYGVELTDQGREHIDCYVDELGFINKRPGLVQKVDFGLGVNKPVEGLFWFPHKGFALGVCDNKVYKITESSGTLTGSSITTNGPGTSYTPTFTVGVDANLATPTTFGIIAAGGAMIQGNGTGSTITNFATIGDAQAPTTVSHVDFIDNYLLATTGKGYFQFSDLSDPLSWSASSIATAMRNPDTIRALKVYNRQIFLFGDVTTEIWENDGTSPFAPNPGGYLNTGIIAAYSVVTSEEGIYWLNDRRHFVVFNGTLQTVSTPYDKEIASYSNVSDCIGLKVEVRGRPFILFQFPSEGVTLAYSILDKNWAQWNFYDSAVGEYSHFLGKSYCYAPTWGLHLMGSRKSSVVYELTEDAKTDDGEHIRMKILTGHIDHGSPNYKVSKRLVIRAKRGEGILSGEDPVLMIRWNDDNKGWSNVKEVSLGRIGDEEVNITIYPRGRYRTRQYEIVITDSGGVSFGRAFEDIDLLGV